MCLSIMDKESLSAVIASIQQNSNPFFLGTEINFSLFLDENKINLALYINFRAIYDHVSSYIQLHETFISKLLK